MDMLCRFCGAKHWRVERVDGTITSPTFSHCCHCGKVVQYVAFSCVTASDKIRVLSPSHTASQTPNVVYPEILLHWYIIIICPILCVPLLSSFSFDHNVHHNMLCLCQFNKPVAVPSVLPFMLCPSSSCKLFCEEYMQHIINVMVFSSTTVPSISRKFSTPSTVPALQNQLHHRCHHRRASDMSCGLASLMETVPVVLPFVLTAILDRLRGVSQVLEVHVDRASCPACSTGSASFNIIYDDNIVYLVVNILDINWSLSWI